MRGGNPREEGRSYSGAVLGGAGRITIGAWLIAESVFGAHLSSYFLVAGIILMTVPVLTRLVLFLIRRFKDEAIHYSALTPDGSN
jgi:hypothetical protein